MTLQTNDIFRHRGVGYSVAGISEGDLFLPSSIGLKSWMHSTDCWRGYQASFAVDGTHLVVATLRINLAEQFGDDFARTPPPVRNGVTPRFQDQNRGLPWDDEFNTVYEGLNLHLSYTGGVLIGDGLADGIHVDDFGFLPPWKYETVIELLFDNGVLIGRHDQSATMQSVRRWGESALSKETGHQSQSLRKIIDETFDRTYPILSGT